METITIDFHVPSGWSELSDKQLRYVYQLIANDSATDEIKTLCLLQWSGVKECGGGCNILSAALNFRDSLLIIINIYYLLFIQATKWRGPVTCHGII